MRPQILSHISLKTDEQTESVEDTLSSHKDQIENSLGNIAACITMINEKIKNTQYSCEYIVNTKMSHIEQLLRNIQIQQNGDKSDIKQQILDLKNMDIFVFQSNPLSDTPRFEEPRFQTKLSPLQEMFGNWEHASQENAHMTDLKTRNAK